MHSTVFSLWANQLTRKVQMRSLFSFLCCLMSFSHLFFFSCSKFESNLRFELLLLCFSCFKCEVRKMHFLVLFVLKEKECVLLFLHSGWVRSIWVNWIWDWDCEENWKQNKIKLLSIAFAKLKMKSFSRNLFLFCPSEYFLDWQMCEKVKWKVHLHKC